MLRAAGLRRDAEGAPPSGYEGGLFRFPLPLCAVGLFHLNLSAHPGVDAALKKVFALGEADDL